MSPWRDAPRDPLGARHLTASRSSVKKVQERLARGGMNVVAAVDRDREPRSAEVACGPA